MALKGCKPQVHLGGPSKHAQHLGAPNGGEALKEHGGVCVKMESNILLNRRARLYSFPPPEAPSTRRSFNVLERTRGGGKDLHSDTRRFAGRGFSSYWIPAV